ATAIRFLDRGETVVVAGGEPGRAGDVRLLEARTGAVRRVLARSTDVICDVAVRPGRTELAAAGADGLLRIVDAATGDEVRTLSSHGDWVTAVAYSDDGGRLASASRDKTVKVFDAAGGELVATFGGHASPVRGVALSADGKQGFSVGDDKRLLRWNADDGKAIGNPVALGGEGLRLVRDGERVFVPTGGKSVAAVEPGSGKVVPVPHADWPLCVAVHTETGRLASGSLDGEVRLFTLQDGALVRAWPARP
ncbi:MAG: WD40 repeat domain-containing protein, partial [Planctomycetia bacterium]